MIKLFTGTPGSGKSLHAAKMIYYTLRSGRPVIANFDINTKSIKHRKNRELKFIKKENYEITPQFLVNFALGFWKGKRVKEEEILLVIDEAQVMFDSRQWQKADRHEWVKFFAQHRKFGYHIVLICQFDGMIDKQMRAMIEYKVIHRRVSNFGLFGLVLSFLAWGPVFVAVKVWPALNKKVDQEFFMPKKKYYSIYDTLNTFEKS